MPLVHTAVAAGGAAQRTVRQRSRHAWDAPLRASSKNVAAPFVIACGIIGQQ